MKPCTPQHPAWLACAAPPPALTSSSIWRLNRWRATAPASPIPSPMARRCPGRELAIAHEIASAADLAPAQRRALLLDFDRVLGLLLDAPVAEQAPLPAGAAELLERRAAARSARDFAASDDLRDQLAALGVEVRDTPEGQETTVRQT
jgi:hypothetical protein